MNPTSIVLFSALLLNTAVISPIALAQTSSKLPVGIKSEISHQEVWSGDTVKTGDQGARFVIEKTKTVISVAPHSELKVQANATPETVELISGMARARVQKLIPNNAQNAPKFILRSKSATMGVRGTDFLGLVTPVLGESEIIVFEGNVDFASTKDASDVKYVPAGHWGGIGGRFGEKTHDLIALPKAALDYFDRASTVR